MIQINVDAKAFRAFNDATDCGGRRPCTFPHDAVDGHSWLEWVFFALVMDGNSSILGVILKGEQTSLAVFKAIKGWISHDLLFSSADKKQYGSDVTQAGFPCSPDPSDFLYEPFAFNLSTPAFAMSDSHGSMLIRGVERILKKPYICSL